MSRHLAARYYDWAMAPEHWYWSRLLVALPLLPAIPLLLIAQSVMDRIGVTDAAVRSVVMAVAFAPVPLWLGYMAWRIGADAIRSLAWFRRLTRPHWRSGWRAAWNIVRGRGGTRS